jgi:hypothetical protein
MFSSIGRPPSSATRTNGSAFTTKGHKFILETTRALQAGHTIRWNTTGQIFFELTLKMERQVGALNLFIKKYLPVIFANQGMEICLVGIASDIHLQLKSMRNTDKFFLNN